MSAKTALRSRAQDVGIDRRIEQVLDDFLAGAGAMKGRGSGQRPHADFGAELLVALLQPDEGIAERADDAQAADETIGRVLGVKGQRARLLQGRGAAGGDGVRVPTESDA